jgi:catechol 2,3-dioxygenase-like lactoylglutathione lyase family enzyme
MTKPTIELSINIDVPDVDAATRFYTEAFGFRVGRRLGAAGVELLGGPAPLYLLPKEAGSASAPAIVPPAAATRRTFERHWTPVHLDIIVTDIEPARARALAAGARPESDITDHLWGRMALLADPFGHGVCLIQFTGRGYDAIATG